MHDDITGGRCTRPVRSDIVIYLDPTINLITKVRNMQCRVREPEVNLLVDEGKGLLIGLSQRTKV